VVTLEGCNLLAQHWGVAITWHSNQQQPQQQENSHSSQALEYTQVGHAPSPSRRCHTMPLSTPPAAAQKQCTQLAPSKVSAITQQKTAMHLHHQDVVWHHHHKQHKASHLPTPQLLHAPGLKPLAPKP
jgi:hypothetical protein